MEKERCRRFDRVFPGIGRLHRSSGTSNRRTFEQMDAMFVTLYGQGRADIVRAVLDRKVSPAIVFDAYRRGRLEELPTAETMQLLADTFASWRAAGAWSEWHVLNIAAAERRLFKDMSPKATIAEIPKRLLTLRQGMLTKARTFNITRMIVSAFLRDTVSKASPLYLALQAIPPLPLRNKVEHKPQTPAKLWAAITDADTRACALSMAASGMGPKEYWEDGWERGEGFLLIKGKKRETRVRQVPDLGLTVLPPLTRSAFVQRLYDADVEFTPYDLRRSFMNWMEAAQIPRTRRMLYLGHTGGGDVSFLYEKHEVTEFLAKDRQRLTEWYRTQMDATVPPLVTPVS